MDAYAVVADRLDALGDERVHDERNFLTDCLLVGRQWTLQRRISSAESLSAVMFQTGLRLARYRGLVDSEAPGLAARRSGFVEELATLQHRIALIAARAGSVTTG